MEFKLQSGGLIIWELQSCRTVRFSHYDPEHGLDEIVGGFGSAVRAFGPLRQSVG
jgi:hypothetical protein